MWLLWVLILPPRYKDASHNTDEDSHIHIGNDVVFQKDNFSANDKRVLTSAEIKLKEDAAKIA